MSKTLSRLRDAFDDPLFTRTSHGMQPTPRALELAGELPGILQDIQGLLARQPFDPGTYRGELSVALSEYIGIWLLPQLIARLQFLAPHLTLKSITRAERQLQRMAEGELDFALQLKHTHYGDEFICHHLGGSRPAILARDGHPLSGQLPSWDDILRFPILRLYIADQDEVEIFQNPQTMARQFADDERAAGGFETSHLLTAIEVLRQTDYLMPAPPFLLGNPTVAYKIQALPLPEDIDYLVDYMLVRHQRTANSAVHNWLWEQMLDILKELQVEAQMPTSAPG